jgi:hypothetical protein
VASACSRPIDAAADNGRAGTSAAVAASSRVVGEDEVAGTGLLVGDRRRRQPQITTRPVPALNPQFNRRIHDFASTLPCTATRSLSMLVAIDRSVFRFARLAEEAAEKLLCGMNTMTCYSRSGGRGSGA